MSQFIDSKRVNAILGFSPNPNAVAPLSRLSVFPLLVTASEIRDDQAVVTALSVFIEAIYSFNEVCGVGLISIQVDAYPHRLESVRVRSRELSEKVQACRDRQEALARDLQNQAVKKRQFIITILAVFIPATVAALWTFYLYVNSSSDKAPVQNVVPKMEVIPISQSAAPLPNSSGSRRLFSRGVNFEFITNQPGNGHH